MCKQIVTMFIHKQLKPQQFKETMYVCGQHLCNSQLYLAIHPIASGIAKGGPEQSHAHPNVCCEIEKD